jgi:hypothetical protein
MPMDDLVLGVEFKAPLNISPRMKPAVDAAAKTYRRIMGAGALPVLFLR